MTGKDQPRFRLSGDEDAPNVVKFKPKPRSKPLPRTREEFNKLSKEEQDDFLKSDLVWTHPNNGKNPGPGPAPKPLRKPEKEMNLLDQIQVHLDPERYTPMTIAAILAPTQQLQAHVPVITEMLADATVRSNEGETITFSAKQCAMLFQMHMALNEMVAVLSEAGFGLEWSAALNAMLLKHLMDNPDEKEQVTQTLDFMFNAMMKFAGDDEETTDVE